MDTLSNKILELLKDDSRYTNKEIGSMLNISENDAAEKIAQLEKNGVIAKYSTVVNSAAYDDTLVDAIIEVKVTPQARSGFDKIAERICAFKEVNAMYLMSGAFDFLISIEGKSMREISMFVSEKLSVVESVTGTATYFILKKYKENGVVFFKGGKGDDRIIQ